MVNDGGVYTISTVNYTSEYSRMSNVQAAETYEFTITQSGTHKYVTVRQGSFNGSVVGHGMSPLQITTTSNLDLYVHWNEDPACNGQSVSHTTTYQCVTCTPPPPPANDDCLGATAFPTIPTNGSCATVSSSTVAATQSQTACVGSGADDDVWLSFVATAGTHNFEVLNVAPIGGSSLDMVFEVFSGNCGGLNSLLCSDPNAGSVSGLTVGATYYVRVFTYFTSNEAAFDLCISTPPPPPSNDLCANAKSLSCGGGYTGEDATNATSTGNPTPCSGSIGDGVWYTFIGTGDNLNVTVSPSGWDPEVGIYTGSCGALNCEISVDGAGTGGQENINSFPTTNGVVYTIFVSGYAFGVPGGAFDISITCTTPPPPPPNNDCFGATPFPSIPTDGTCATVSGTTEGATQTQSACVGSGADDDVWFSFIATSTTHEFEISNVSATTGSSTDMVFEIFSGSCGGLISLLCSDPNNASLSGLIVGQTYYARVFTYFTSSRVSFDFCISTPPPPPPNDDCINATFVTGQNMSGTNIAATPDWPSGLIMSCNGSYDNNVWYEFQAYTSNVTFEFTNIQGGANGVQIGVFEQPPSCTSTSWNEVGCESTGSSGDFTLNLTGLIPGAIYIIVIDGWAGSENTFNFQITGGGPLPIELIDFSGRAREKDNLLQWTVALEKNVSHFELQRSANGQSDWISLGSKPSQGNTESKRTYSMVDNRAQPAAYYRLRSVDLDGSSQLSPVIFLRRPPGGAQVSIYPNPAQGPFTLQLPAAAQPGLRVQLFTPQGKPVFEKKYSSLPEIRDVQIDPGPLAPGLYLLRVQHKGGEWQGKVVIK